MFTPKTLQRRLQIYLLLPVAVLLFSMGVLGFVYARSILFSQWGEAVILKLQRAAHQVDMQLGRPKALIRNFHKTGDSPYFRQLHESILAQLGEAKGVARVDLTWENRETTVTGPASMNESAGRTFGRHAFAGQRRMMSYKHSGIQEVTPPQYDSLIRNKTVSLVSDLEDENGSTLGKLEVVIRFDHIIEAVITSGWLQSHQAYLVDDHGNVLMSTFSDAHKTLGYHDDPLELETLDRIKKQPFGTLVGRRHGETEVSGFYRLTEAPWNLVMFAPAGEILEPISRFRRYYFATGTVFILLTLLLIRVVVGRSAASIKEVSKAAVNVSRGDYSQTLAATTRDEVGELIQSFNTMILQLKERSRIKAALSLAGEVQQNLIPKEIPKIEGVDIGARVIYCEETGGDYYDFIEFGLSGEKSPAIVLGDVSDHGISSALLMATVRSSFRQRSFMPGSLADMVSDVNRQLARDVMDSGQFMTLFSLIIDNKRRRLHWVRAGHDPGMFYDPKTDTFEELKGPGIALGVDEHWEYEENEKTGIDKGQIIVLATDGIWEALNPGDEMFGKARILETVRDHRSERADDILESILRRFTRFRDGRKLEDDVTLIVIKIENGF